ncbi:MAG: PQQ-dependent sugar dehydrogenase [Bdellovibrionota bacterium]
MHLYFSFALIFLASSQLFAQNAVDKNIFESEKQKGKVEILLQRSNVIWGFDFLSAHEIIYTERNGGISIFNLKTQTSTELSGVPKVFNQGQGGMLDVSVVPLSKGKQILFTYSLESNGKNTTAVGKANIEKSQLKNLTRIFTANAWSKNKIHFGSRIAWESPKVFYLSIGERNERDLAQKLNTHNGKILRLTLEGKAAKGNPFENKKGALPEIWSYGHRNPQGLTLDPKNNLIEAEFGPKGGDEVNLIKKGHNYGWPAITYGREYWGPKIGDTHKPGMEQPLVYWVPSISPSNIAFYSGKLFPTWKENLFLANLSGQHLRRVVFDKNYKVLKQEVLLNNFRWRIRDVQEGPDGRLYISTDNGAIAALSPI